MKISIITINLNNADGLRRTIKSVINQSYGDIEYIVIDGASSDSSVKVIEEFNDKIHYWCSERDSGIYDAMNKGGRNATGEYCLFLNSGDTLAHTNSLYDAIKQFEWDADIISFGKLSYLKHSMLYVPPMEYKPSSLMMMIMNPIPHPSTFIRTDVFKKVQYDDSYKIAGDYVFFYEVLIRLGCSYRGYDVLLTEFAPGGISSQDGNKTGRDEGIRYLRSIGTPEELILDIKYGKDRRNINLYAAHALLSPSLFKLLYAMYTVLLKFEYYFVKKIKTKIRR